MSNKDHNRQMFNQSTSNEITNQQYVSATSTYGKEFVVSELTNMGFSWGLLELNNILCWGMWSRSGQ
jgi:hypothetical protein